MRNKHFVIIVSILTIIVVVDGFLTFSLLKKECNCQNTTIDGYFDLSDYEEKLNKEIPLQYSYGLMINDVEIAKLVAEKVWNDTDNSAIENYKVYFDFKSNTWLIIRALPKDTFGSALYLIIKTNGDILAVWHDG